MTAFGVLKNFDMLVSVIIPVYNAEKFLKRSIGSVINQSYEKLELILINDGSTDKSEVICRQYALSDRRIVIVSQKNRGPAAARNTGIRNASGECIFFLDADDFIDHRALEILISEYSARQPGLVMSNFYKLESNGKIINQNVTLTPDGEPFTGKIRILSKMDIVEYIRHFLKHPSNHLISYCWARLYKLSIIKSNNIIAKEDMRLFEDFVFNLEYLKHCDETVFINQPLYTYTMPNNHVTASMAIINSDSLSHDTNTFKIKTAEFLKSKNAKKEAGHAIIHYYIIYMIRSCRQINRDTKDRIYNEINKTINAPIFVENLKYYSPQKGNSRILPLLARFKLINLIMLYCRYKAHKRYGKLEGK